MSHRKSKSVPQGRRRTVRRFENNLHELLVEVNSGQQAIEAPKYEMPKPQLGYHRSHTLRTPYAWVVL